MAAEGEEEEEQHCQVNGPPTDQGGDGSGEKELELLLLSGRLG
jgi:hypothetical protein